MIMAPREASSGCSVPLRDAATLSSDRIDGRHGAAEGAICIELQRSLQQPFFDLPVHRCRVVSECGALQVNLEPIAELRVATMSLLAPTALYPLGASDPLRRLRRETVSFAELFGEHPCP